MADKSFQVGDIVVLKSGGPTMTVESFADFNQHYQCQWFGGRKLESGYFPPNSLRAATEEEKKG